MLDGDSLDSNSIFYPLHVSTCENLAELIPNSGANSCGVNCVSSLLPVMDPLAVASMEEFPPLTVATGKNPGCRPGTANHKENPIVEGVRRVGDVRSEMGLGNPPADDGVKGGGVSKAVKTLVQIVVPAEFLSQNIPRDEVQLHMLEKELAAFRHDIVVAEKEERLSHSCNVGDLGQAVCNREKELEAVVNDLMGHESEIHLNQGVNVENVIVGPALPLPKPADQTKGWNFEASQKLIRNNRKPTKKVPLSFVKTNGDIVEVPESGLDSDWDFTLIGYFTGHFPGLGTWNVRYSLKNHDSG